MPSKNLTYCTVCKRDDVGAVQNWNRWQADQSDEWRVTRHLANPKVRGQICPGTGVHIEPEHVFPREVPA